MTAKERRKVKHTLKASIDTADIWLKVAIDAVNALGLNKEDLKGTSANSRQTIISSLEQAKKEISENYNKFMSEIETAISDLK